VLGQFAQHIISNGFVSLANPPARSPLLPSSLDDARANAITTAMTNSFVYLDSTTPTCPRLSPWQTTILSEHNVKRSMHCAQPLSWDDSLAQAAESWASTCPSNFAQSSPTVSENVVLAATPTNNPQEVVVSLFDNWYTPQASNYANRYQTAIGPCTGGFNYSTSPEWNFTSLPGSECVPDSSATSRVTEFTQVVWRGHTTVGCAYRQCAFGNVLVCRYGGSSRGNVLGQFQANVVPPRQPGGPLACGLRAWDSMVRASAAAWVGQSYVPRRITALLNGSITTAEFQASTTLSALSSQGAAANIPVRAMVPPLPPLPPMVSAPAPPLMPLSGGADALSASGRSQPDVGGDDYGWVYGVVLGICLPLLLCCVSTIVLYRVSGGEPGVWATVHYTHGNQKISFLYLTPEEREVSANNLAVFQKAMADAMGTYSNGFSAYWNMVADHRNFIKAGGLDAAQSNTDSDYAVPYPEKEADPVVPQVEPDAPVVSTGLAKISIASEAEADEMTKDEEPTKPAAPQRVLPDHPSIDTDLDAEFAESPEDRARRIEWIKFFVREGDLQKAFDLGWDGKPFRQAAVIKSPAEEPTATSGGNPGAALDSWAAKAETKPASSEPGASSELHRI